MALLSAMLVACGDSPAATPPVANVITQPASRSTTPANAGAPANAGEIILAAINTLDSNGPYRMRITSNLDTSPIEMLIVPPDRTHYKSSYEGKPVEIIGIGDTSYVLDDDGTWLTSTAETGSVSEPSVLQPSAATDLTNIQSLGTQIINGVNAVGYSFIDVALPDETTTLWINPDGAPIQIGTSSAQENLTFNIEYDPGITVEAPVK